MPLPSGTRLGSYELVGQIGAGGMGEVYKARDPKLDRFVAIKVLPEGFGSDEDRLKRFRQEARVLASLSHPNVVQVFEAGEHAGAPFLVMELLEGETLRERLHGRAMPAKRAAELARDVANGLAAAHGKGILHRDLKPENIFITKDGRVKVLDFGLAKKRVTASDSRVATATLTAAVSEPGHVVGTSGYMSPEQVRGGTLDARSDLFSLGVVLWEMVSGAKPFKGGSSVEVMNAILKEDPPELDPALKIPPAFERILHSCLAKGPEGRFHSAHDLAFALDGFSAPSGSSHVDPYPHSRKWPVRMIAGFLAGLLVSLAWLGLASVLHWVPFHFQVQPTFHRLTYRRGNVVTARFAQDGAAIVYGANWDNQEADIFESAPGQPQTKALGIPGADLLAVSKKGELAILLHGQGLGQRAGFGTLARMSLMGGSPRELLGDVFWADWGPDGESLAVFRRVGNVVRLEYPIGQVWCEVKGSPMMLRVSPSGRAVAYVESREPSPRIQVVDREGRSTSLFLGDGHTYGLAWSRDGKCLYTSWGRSLYDMGLWELPLGGKPRLLLSGPKSYYLNDVDGVGRILAELSSHRKEALLQTGTASPKVITWLDSCDVVDLATDGQTVLMVDRGEASGSQGSLWLRRPGTRDPVHLGEGLPLGGLSPDGTWAPVSRLDRRHEVVLLPTGAGQVRSYPLGELSPIWAHWFPDGRRLLLGCLDAGGGRSDRVLDLDKGTGTPLEGWIPVRNSGIAFSPDGLQIVLKLDDGRLALLPSDGGRLTFLPVQLQPRERILQWSQDGRELFIVNTELLPIRIERIELKGGRRIPWKEISLDPAEYYDLNGIAMTRDGHSLAY